MDINYTTIKSVTHVLRFFCQQMQWPLVVLTLVLALVQSIWMRLAALAMRLPSSAVVMLPTNNFSVDMGTGRMLE